MVEIIPKQAQRLPLWQNILFYFSLALLLAAVLSYFVFDNFQKKNSRTLINLNEVLKQGKTAQEKQMEEAVLVYQKKISSFGELIKGRRHTSEFFDFFGGLAHPRAWFSKFELDLEENKLAVSGQTDSFQTLGQQLIIFQNEKNIIEVDLSDVSLGKEGKVEFIFNLVLEPSLF